MTEQMGRILQFKPATKEQPTLPLETEAEPTPLEVALDEKLHEYTPEELAAMFEEDEDEALIDEV